MKKIISIVCVTLILITLGSCGSKSGMKDLNSKNDAYYQLFVRSFADSNGDGIGDFNGITENVDYLVDLGIEGVWLMPFHPTSTYHGYDVEDYYDVNSKYGTMSDFDRMISTLHKKGIKVIMDFVLNHTSNKNPWFLEAVDALKSGDTENKYLKYYQFVKTGDKRIGTMADGNTLFHSISGSDYYYGYFSGTMPDLNYSNRVVRDEMISVGKFWIDKGIDGFRLDGAYHIYGANELKADGSPIESTLNILDTLRIQMEKYGKKKKKDIYIVAEVYSSISTYADFYKNVDSCFDFDTAKGIIEKIKGSGSSYTSGLAKTYKKIDEKVSEGYQAINAPFLTNHDQDRIASELNGNQEQLKFAAELLLTQEGNPFVYYGEELGMKGVKGNGSTKDNDGADMWDQTRRLPFIWGNSTYQTTWCTDTYNTDLVSYEDQKDDAASLFNTYKTLLNLRKNSYALKYGEFERIETKGSIQAFYRTVDQDGIKEKVLVIHNFELTPLTTDLVEDGDILYYSGGIGNFKDNTLDAYSTVIIKVK